MKKFLVILMLLIIACTTCTTTIASAESAASEMKRFYNLAEFYGYTISDMHIMSCSSEPTCEVRLSNSKVRLIVYVRETKKCLSYYCDGKTMKLSGMEKLLKKNAVQDDRILLVTGKVQGLGDRLEQYAERQGFEVVSHFCHIGKKPYDELKLNNGRKTFTVRISGELKNKRVVITYKWNKKTVSQKKIKSNIQKYAPAAHIW